MTLIIAFQEDNHTYVVADKISKWGDNSVVGTKIIKSMDGKVIMGGAGSGTLVNLIMEYFNSQADLLDPSNDMDGYLCECILRIRIINYLTMTGHIDGNKVSLNYDADCEIIFIYKDYGIEIAINKDAISAVKFSFDENPVWAIGNCSDMVIGAFWGFWHMSQGTPYVLTTYMSKIFSICSDYKGCGKDFDVLSISH